MDKIGGNYCQEPFIEYERARTRLLAYKTSIQTYPPWSEDTQEIPLASSSQPFTLKTALILGFLMGMSAERKRIDKIQSELIATRDTLLDHIKAKKKGTKKTNVGIEL